MNKIIVATNNQGKIKEIRDIFSDMPFNLLSLKDINLNVNIEEDQPGFAGNSYKKAYEICRLTNEIVLADDSGLTVDALGGKPGVYSARFAGENATDRENYEKLLEMLKDVPFNLRTAAFVCVVTVAYPDGKFIQSEGICPGRIGFKPVGNGGFGYDPVFIVDALNKTMAEATAEEKNSLSHRGMALKKIKEMMAGAI